MSARRETDGNPVPVITGTGFLRDGCRSVQNAPRDTRVHHYLSAKRDTRQRDRNF